MQFWKMHGLGNDYVVLDNRNLMINDKHAPRLAEKLCLRQFSVGADGLLLVCPSQVADVKMRIFNADGSEAEMCGNGIRCFSKYCYEKGIVKKTEFNVETLAGIKPIRLTLEGDRVVSIKVEMGPPNWQRSSLPMVGDGTCINEKLEVANDLYKVTCLSMGNPHCVTFVGEVDVFPVYSVGKLIENHKAFPKRTNAVFVQVLSRNELAIRVWERGCGETLACGTGICAGVAAAHKQGKIGNKVAVHALGGDLQVEIGDTIYLIGPAEKVFEGRLFKET
jgi:diaminopimelate epimerase